MRALLLLVSALLTRLSLPMTDAERSHRYRALKGPRRREGKGAVTRRRQKVFGDDRYILFSLTRISQSCKSPSYKFVFAPFDPEPDKRLDVEQVKLERLQIEALLDYLGALEPVRGRPAVPASVRHGFVRRFILERIVPALAAEERAFCHSGNTRTKKVHFARRMVAGWGQLLDLWEMGEDAAMMEASEHGVLVFRGVKYVAHLI